MSTCPRPHRWLFLALLSMIVLAACKADQKQRSETDPPPAASTASNATPAPVAPPPAVTQASWAPDALEELLAPIALYPDQLLTQILAVSVNTQEVLDGGNWLLDHQNLQGEALDAAARQAGFGAAMRALLQVPTVVDMLCQQIDWTRQLGSAFSSDQKSVLDAVQRLRLQATKVGNLQSTPQQTVETRTESNQTIVEVKPADPQIVYVPQYNPQVVYTTPPPAPAPATTTTSDDDTVSTETAVAAGLIGFGVGALIGSALDDDDDYCCYPNWGHSTVVVGTRPFYPPAYAYRPAYGSGFRPGYGYNPPAGYRHNSGNYQRGRQGNTTNINVDNSNYFNRFSNNQNLRGGATESPVGRGANRTAATTEGGRAENWKGQSTYRGARDDATSQQLTRETAERARAQSDGTRLADASNGRASSGERTARSTQSIDRPARSANVDRGYGDGPSLQSPRANVQRSAPDIQRPAPETSGSVPDIQRPDTSIQRPDAAAARAQERPRDSAFSGARDSGSFERSASARGRASGGGRGGGGRRR